MKMKWHIESIKIKNSLITQMRFEKNQNCEVFAHSQDFRIQSFKLFLWSEQTNVKTYNDELFFNV